MMDSPFSFRWILDFNCGKVLVHWIENPGRIGSVKILSEETIVWYERKLKGLGQESMDDLRQEIVPRLKLTIGLLSLHLREVED